MSIIRNKALIRKRNIFLGDLESKCMELSMAYGGLSKWFNEIIKFYIYDYTSQNEFFTIIACEMCTC